MKNSGDIKKSFFCFVSQLLQRNDNKRNVLCVPLDFIILQLSSWNLIHTEQQCCTSVRALAYCIALHVRPHLLIVLMGACVHGFTACECVTNTPVKSTAKTRQDQAAAPGAALVETCIRNKFFQITPAHT